MNIVKFTKAGKVNGKEVPKGTTMRVSASIFKDLTEVQKCVREVAHDAPKKDDDLKRAVESD